MKLNKKTDLIILIAITLLSALIAIFCKANFLLSTFLLFGLPCVYLVIRNKKALLKTFLFALLCSVPLTFIIEYLVAKDNGWQITNSMFSFRIFDLIALEQFLWGFFWFFYIVIFYEYFLDKPEKKTLLSFFSKKLVITKRMEYFAMILFTALLLFISVVLISPSLIRINYAYLVLAIILVVIPLTLFLIKFPNFYTRFSKVTLYFFFVAIIVEYTGLRLDLWNFPGTHYIGTLNFFGHRIPYEEVLFFFVLSIPAALSYYEFLDDDQR